MAEKQEYMGVGERLWRDGYEGVLGPDLRQEMLRKETAEGLVVTFTATPKEREALDQLAQKTGLNHEQVLRQALRLYQSAQSGICEVRWLSDPPMLADSSVRPVGM